MIFCCKKNWIFLFYLSIKTQLLTDCGQLGKTMPWVLCIALVPAISHVSSRDFIYFISLTCYALIKNQMCFKYRTMTNISVGENWEQARTPLKDANKPSQVWPVFKITWLPVYTSISDRLKFVLWSVNFICNRPLTSEHKSQLSCILSPFHSMLSKLWKT